jgi:hypothetical protein
VVASGGDLSAADVRSVFDRALEDLEEGRTKDGRKGTLIANALRYDARLAQVSGNEIQFVTSDLLKSRFEKPQPQSNIDDVFSRWIGKLVRIKFLTEDEAAALAAGSSGKTTSGAEVDSETDALVKMATEELGGKIVD